MYSNPVTTIASIGAANTPIPITIESSVAPTERPNGVPLQIGDVWYNKLTQIEYIYILINQFDRKGWQPVGGAGYINEVIDTTPTDDIVIPPATTAKIGGVIVGDGLLVSNNGTLTINPVEDLQTLKVHGTSTLHTVITGADADGIAINAGAGQIIGQWMNLGQNPTINTADPNYGVSLRTPGKIICGELVPTQIICGGTVIGNTINATIVEGARQGLVYKLQAGTGLTFEGQLHTYIGGTVGNDYNTNTGTLGINEAIVVTKTGPQTINGDLFLTGAGPNASGTLNSLKLNLNNYATVADLGPPNVGSMAFVNSSPYYSNGVTWTSLVGATSYVLPTASPNTLGGVKIGANVNIDADGVISVATPYTLPVASDTTLGGVKVGANLTITDGVLAGLAPFVLPTATGSTLGGVIVGSNLTITNGVLSANPDYTLPAATTLALGGVIVGDNLAVASDGTLSLASDQNIELGDGYVRTERANEADAAFEARQGTSLNFKVLAGGHVAIGGTIDDSASQTGANIFLKNDGSSLFKQTLKINNPSSGQTVIQLGSAGLLQATGGVDIGGLVGGTPNAAIQADGDAEFQSVTVKDVLLSENYADTTAAGTPTLGRIVMIGGAPYFGNGTQWMAIQLGSG